MSAAALLQTPQKNHGHIYIYIIKYIYLGAHGGRARANGPRKVHLGFDALYQ